MLESQASKPQENDCRENKAIEDFYNLKTEHDVSTGWTASDKKYFLMRHQFGSPKMLKRSATQRNKNLLRCKINRSLNFDFNFSRKDYLRRLSPNSTDNSCFNMNKSPRELSRSAKIMRALSSDISFCHRNENIKKSLQFELSPKKANSSDESTSVDSTVNTPLHTPDKFLRLDRNSSDTSTTSSVPTASSESIDENQNRTPQQNRKVNKILSDTSNTKRSADKSGSRNASLLRSNMKELIDNITRNAQTPDFQCLKQGDKLRASSYDIAASTPRNLFKEFGNDGEDSPHTPENMMQYIPEGMSSIKKSHKKERLYHIERKALEADDSVKNLSLCTKRITESLEADDISTNSDSYVAPMKESPKKSRNVKKTLVYNLDDEFSDNESISNAEQKAASKNIDSSDCEVCEENTQDIHDTLPSTSSTSNYNEKKNDSYLQKTSSSNVDLAGFEKKMSGEYEEIYSRSELIQQSQVIHDYMRFLDSNRSSKEVTEVKPHEKCSEMTRVESILDLDLLLRRMSNSPRTHKRHTFENERPITPENMYSSRLLLPQYTSVKKSHKKDKRKNKSISDISKYDVMDNKYKKSVSLFTDYQFPEVNIDEYRNESFPVRSSSPDEFNQKRKRFMSMSLQNHNYELACSPKTCQNIDDEFKIYTPIRKRMPSILDTVKNYVCKDKVPLERDNESTEAVDTADENGRLTPINMSTAKLLHNIDSIKKSHKKDKHVGSICKKLNLEKKLSEYTKKAGNMNVTDCTETSEDHPSLKLNPNDDSYEETEACSTRNEDNRKSNEESIYDPQPSTSRENSVIESEKNLKTSQPPSTTPPNNWKTLKFMKLLHATSIKKSHKKERDLNAQSKYILMNHEYDLSDDGSIFDEEDKLTYVESSSPCKYNNK